MKFNQQSLLAFLTVLVIGLNACQQAGGNKTGSEFIPDMAHSVAYEANVNTDYSLSSWDEQSVLSRRKLSQPRLPVEGTIARGYSSVAIASFENAISAASHTVNNMKRDEGIAYTPNGSVPYYFPDTEEGRTSATNELIYNPFPITQTAIAKGQELYNYYCGICHGEKGDGAGYLVRDNGGKYPAQPANFLLEEFVNANNGRYYHSIMYGKNAMGAYADKLSYEERWNVIHYIRSLQAKSLKVKYDQEVNELNADFGVPVVAVKSSIPNDPTPSTTPMSNDDHNPTGHNGNHGHTDKSAGEEEGNQDH